MKIKKRSDSPLKKKARRAFRGYPQASVAFYGPDDQFASKVAVGISETEGGEIEMKRWFSEGTDVRHDPVIEAGILAFLRDHAVKSVAMLDQIIGCPHEEMVDYPEGEACPRCPFWAHRNRWTGELEE